MEIDLVLESPEELAVKTIMASGDALGLTPDEFQKSRLLYTPWDHHGG